MGSGCRRRDAGVEVMSCAGAAFAARIQYEEGADYMVRPTRPVRGLPAAASVPVADDGESGADAVRG
jgi:hypothetical protein